MTLSKCLLRDLHIKYSATSFNLANFCLMPGVVKNKQMIQCLYFALKFEIIQFYLIELISAQQL